MITSPRKILRSISFCAFVAIFSILLPIVLSLRGLSSFVGATYGESSKLLEFSGLSGFLAVALIVAWTIKQNRPSDAWGYLNILLPAAVALVWLNIQSENTQKSWDYFCYERAAQSFLNGKNPYQDCYFYPPLVISIFSRFYTAIQYTVTLLRGVPIQSEKAWMLIFYLYQYVQWFMVILAYLLSHRLTEKYGLSKILSLGAVTALYILNNPLLRTLRFNQVNLWVLNIVLLILLFNTTHPFTTGLLAALGAHIKLYPALFVAPWILLKDKRALAGFVVGIIALLGLTIGLSGGITPWSQFINNVTTHEGGEALRDNSLHSLFYNFLRITAVIHQRDPKRITDWLTALSSFLIGIWFFVRMIAWYRILQKHRDFHSVCSFERDGLLADILGLMLLISPMAWEHHYVLVMPIMLRTFALQIREKQLPIASLLAFSFIFGIPTFDVFPLSYLRLLGLFILLIKSDPILVLKKSAEFQAAKASNQADANPLFGRDITE